MRLILSPKKMQGLALSLKQNRKTIALVPTMGFLHDGHLKLVSEAKKRAQVVVVSIFVNPMQFGKNEDLGRYPRDEKNDLAKLKKLGVNFVFLPQVKDVYPKNFQTSVEVCEMSQGLCGKSRPGHFVGVATVVLKLLNIVQPDVAVFGKKDFQQLRVIQTLVHDLNLPVKIHGVAIVREKDGLALSSRNTYLTLTDRGLALGLSRGINAVRAVCCKQRLSAIEMQNIFLAELSKSEQVRVDYVACVDAQTLKPVDMYQKGRTLLAVAVFVGTTRLIDNAVF